MRGSIFGLIALAACSTGAGGFQTHEGTRVNPVSADVFEVIARPGNEVNQFWCGAGEYARRALGAPPNARVYVVRAAGRAETMDAPSAVQFSLNSPGAGPSIGNRGSHWGPWLGESKFVGDASRGCGRDVNRFPI